MGSSASTQKNKVSVVQPQSNPTQKQEGGDSIFDSPKRNVLNETPKLAHINSPIMRRSPQLRSSEKIIDCNSPLQNDRFCGQSSNQHSDVSEQDQIFLNNQHRTRKVSRFVDKRQLNDTLNQRNQKEFTPLSQRNNLLNQHKEMMYSSKSAHLIDVKNSQVRYPSDTNHEEFNLPPTVRDAQSHVQFDNHSKQSYNNNNNHEHFKGESMISQNILNQISQLNKKMVMAKHQNESNLFSNEADILYRSKGNIKEEEKNLQKKSTLLGTQINNNLASQNGSNSQINLNATASFSKTQQLNQMQTNLQTKNQDQSKKIQNGDGNQLFKHEVIQISKNKSNKECFKKGNIYLSVQDENSLLSKKMDKNSQENIIADLITNNISVTDFLLSDRQDIQEQIIMNKQQKKLQQQRLQDFNKNKKPVKDFKYAYANSNSAAETATSLDPSTKNTLNTIQSSTNLPEQKNIIISYTSDWESMRRTALQSNVK